MAGPDTLAYRTVGEWAVELAEEPPNPFLDIIISAVFASPSGKRAVVPAFYDGNRTWRVRFSPDETGDWTLDWVALPTRCRPPPSRTALPYLSTTLNIRGHSYRLREERKAGIFSEHIGPPEGDLTDQQNVSRG